MVDHFLEKQNIMQQKPHNSLLIYGSNLSGNKIINLTIANVGHNILTCIKLGCVVSSSELVCVVGGPLLAVFFTVGSLFKTLAYLDINCSAHLSLKLTMCICIY